MVRAVSLLEQGQRGEFADLHWSYEFIEQTDPDLLALVERRTAALLEMDWNIKTVPEEFRGYDADLAARQADALRAAYDRIDNLYEAIEHLEMAAFRGFAIAQPHLDNGGAITHLECLDQWNFVRDGRYGRWGWNPSGRCVGFAQVAPADVLDAEQFIIRTVRRPIDRIGFIKFVRSNLSEKDWDGYIEIFGIPGAFVIGPPDVPKEKEKEYVQAAEDAAEGGGGYLPNGSDVKFPSDVRSVQPFEVRLDWLSKKLVLAGTGGMLTMLTESGSGTLAGGAHTETFKAIGRAEAQRISEILQRAIDRRVLDAVSPGKPRLAYFDMAAEEELDVGAIVTHFQGLAAAGLQVHPEDASEPTGYKFTLRPPAPAA
jgi:phage gp29-like protein